LVAEKQGLDIGDKKIMAAAIDRVGKAMGHCARTVTS
jgi:hypothetical protein